MYKMKGAALGFLLRFAALIMILVIGGLIFMKIENKKEHQSYSGYARPRKPVLPSFIKNMTSKHSMNLSSSQFTTIFREIEDYVHQETWGSSFDDHEGQEQPKNFSEWFYFCFITVTTIGYGDITPTTKPGKLLVIPYGIVGISLMFSVLATIGRALTSMHASIILRCQEGQKMRSNAMSRVYPIIANSFLLMCFVMIGTLVTSKQQKWDYTDSLYYWFATFTTIGYGDFIANGREGNTQGLILWMVFRFVGLSLVASVIQSCIRSTTYGGKNAVALEYVPCAGEKVKDVQATENAKTGV